MKKIGAQFRFSPPDSIQENDIKLSTTAKTDSNAGDYPIKGDNNTLNRTYPNYSFTFKEGTLTINDEIPIYRPYKLSPLCRLPLSHPLYHLSLSQMTFPV